MKTNNDRLRLMTTCKRLPDVLKLQRIPHRGNESELIRKFGGADLPRNPVNQLYGRLYA